LHHTLAAGFTSVGCLIVLSVFICSFTFPCNLYFANFATKYKKCNLNTIFLMLIIKKCILNTYFNVHEK
jgi:hypothetical protein